MIQQRISIGYLPALVTIISVPSESNSSHSDFISSWAPTARSLGWRGFSGLTAAAVVWAVPVEPAPSPGVVLPSVVVSAPRSGSDWAPGDGVVDRCCLSDDDVESSVVLESLVARPASVLTPSGDDVKQSAPAALDKYAATTQPSPSYNEIKYNTKTYPVRYITYYNKNDILHISAIHNLSLRDGFLRNVLLSS